MTEYPEFAVLDNRWMKLYIPSGDGTIPIVEMYRDANVHIGYEFERLYRKIESAAHIGAFSIIFTANYIRAIKNGKIIAEDTQFHNVSSLDRKRRYISLIVEKDEVVRPFIHLIDKGDELILEIREPV